MRTSSLLFLSTFPRRSSPRGPRESLRGSSIENSPTHISILLQVCRIVSRILAILILKFSGLSESEIRRRLTLEEERELLASTVVDSDDYFTETKYLMYGLDLKEQQYVLSICRCTRGTNPILGENYRLHSSRKPLTYHPPLSSNFEPPFAVIL